MVIEEILITYFKFTDKDLVKLHDLIIYTEMANNELKRRARRAI